MSDYFPPRAQLLAPDRSALIGPGREVGVPAYRTAVPHSTAVRLSQFWTFMEDEFGPSYAASLARDLALTALGGRTAQEALDAGLPPREVWLALCDAQEVPEARRHGKDRHQRKTG
jgi:hypothetical protein